MDVLELPFCCLICINKKREARERPKKGICVMQRCYWCGKAIEEGAKVYSLGLFNSGKGKRIFCSQKCKHQYKKRKRNEHRVVSAEKKRHRAISWRCSFFT